ncbi:Protein FAM186A, partial [Galemys pyrenaicus]
DINMQVNDIMTNVQRIINRYIAGESIHSGRRISITEHKRRRNSFLEKIVNCTKSAEVTEKTLVSILAWLEEWNIILSEMTTIDIEEYHHCVAQMEILPETFKAIEGNVTILTGISKSLLEEKRKHKRKITIRGTLWKPWKERVMKRPAAAHALRPDQMISDEFATSTKVSEIHDMLQELIGTAMFSKLENNAIKYISSTIANLSKALSILNGEVKGVNIQSDNIFVEEEGDKEKDLVLKIIQDLSENNEILQQKLQIAEEKYENLIQSRSAIEHQILAGSNLKVLPESAPQSSMGISRADKKESIDIILGKQLEDIDEAQRRESKVSGIKWDTALSYMSTDEMAPDLIEQQSTLQKTPSHTITEDRIKDMKSLKTDDVSGKDGADQLQSQKRMKTRGLYARETSRLNLSDNKGEQKDSGTKYEYSLELQSLEKKRKEIKSYSEEKSKFPESKSQFFSREILSTDVPSTYTKDEAGKGATSNLWERIRKTKLEHPLDKSQVSKDKKEEFTFESTDRERKSEMSSQARPSRSSHLDSFSEKEKIKGKKPQVSAETSIGREEKTEEKNLPGLAKKGKLYELYKSQSRKLKEASESTSVQRSPEGKSEQSNLEDFQKAIMSFLMEKIDNIGKPLDKKIVPKKELLKRADFENLGVIKTKMEEYFQKVAETVTEVLRKYKDMKKTEQVKKKPMKGKKEASHTPEMPSQKSISEKFEIKTLLSPYEKMDPVASNLIQMILTEIESERDVTVASTVERDQKKKKQRQEDYLQEDQEQKIGISHKSQLQEERNLRGNANEMMKKDLELEDAWLKMKEGKQRQQKQWQEKELGKEQQRERKQKQIEQDETQKQREKEEEQHQKSEQQQLEAGKQKRREDGVLGEKAQQMRWVQKRMRHVEKESSWEKLEEKKSKRKAEDHERQKQKEAMGQIKIKEEKSDSEHTVSQTSVTVSPRGGTQTDILQLYQRNESEEDVGTLEITADGKHPKPITSSSSTQSFPSGATPTYGQNISLTTEQAQALGLILTPEQAKALGITLILQQAQAQEISQTRQEAQAQEISLTPQDTQVQGISLTSQQTPTYQKEWALGDTLISSVSRGLGVTHLNEQAQVLRGQISEVPIIQGEVKAQDITLTPEEAQSQGITVTPQQAQGLMLTPEQAQALPQGTILTPLQAQAQGITFTQQVQGEGIILTPQQAQAQGITLTPDQAWAQGITLTPQQAQAQAQSIARSSEQQPQSQAQGISLTPQQPQAQGITLTSEQALAQRITLTPQQVQGQGITQPRQALGMILTPEQMQAQGITLTPQQSQGLGIPLSSHQVPELGIPLIPEGAPTLRITVTSQQAQTQGPSVSSEQFKPMVITHIPEQVQTLRPPLTPDLTQSLEVSLTPKQTQLMQDFLIQEQAQEPVFSLTSEKAQTLDITLSHEQAQAMGISLTPEYTQALRVPLTLDQAPALQPHLTLEQTWKLGVPITPEVVQEVSPTLTSQQIQALRMLSSHKPDQAFGTPFTSDQAQALGIPTTPENALASAETSEQIETLELPLTSDKSHALEFPFRSEQVQPLGVPFTTEQTQPMGILMPEQYLKSRPPLINEHLLQSWVPSILHPFEESKTSLPAREPIPSSPGKSLASSAPITEKPSMFEASTTTLQTSGFPLPQASIDLGKLRVTRIPSDSGKLLGPQTFPFSGQTLLSKDQPMSLQAPTTGTLPKPGAPQTPEKPLVLESLKSRQFLIRKDTLTPKPPLIPKVPLVPGQSLLSGVQSASEQIPGLWSLSPRQAFVPGISSIAEELPESETLALSEQPQAFQPSVTSEQSPYLQPSSTLGQQRLPWTFSDQVSSPWIPPISGHAPTIWAPVPPGKSQESLSFNISKRSKRMAISSLKSKSALVHSIAPKFKTPQAPSIIKKFPVSEVSETPVEIQKLPDPFTMEQFKTLQSFVTSYKIPVSQTSYTDEARPILRKPVTSLPSLITQLPQTSQISPSELDQISRFPPIEKPWILTSVLGTKKPKVIVPPSTPQELKEQRYFVDVEAQRKNLILLNEAMKSSGLSSQLYTTAENLIIETLRTDTVRLGYIFNKYIAYRLIQRSRNNIIKRIQAIQNTGKGYETQNLFVMLSRIDDYQKKVMHTWTRKQNALEQKRNQCLRKMIHLFSKLQEAYHLNLSQPIPLIDKKQVAASTKFVQQPLLELLIEEDKKHDIFKKYRQDQMEAIWNADLSTSSYPITEKTAIHSLWAQLGGYPDIPMLLQLDVQSTFRKSLAAIQSHGE